MPTPKSVRLQVVVPGTLAERFLALVKTKESDVSKFLRAYIGRVVRAAERDAQ